MKITQPPGVDSFWKWSDSVRLLKNFKTVGFGWLRMAEIDISLSDSRSSLDTALLILSALWILENGKTTYVSDATTRASRMGAMPRFQDESRAKPWSGSKPSFWTTRSPTSSDANLEGADRDRWRRPLRKKHRHFQLLQVLLYRSDIARVKRN